MSDLPAPLVPAEVDLRGYEFMPFYGHRLLASAFNAHCSDSEWRAGVTLWWAAWNQVPAASLPDDDVELARLADLGRDVKTWKTLRANALRGFVLCSDGRLHHQVLAEFALEAWDRRVRERQRKASWRSGRPTSRNGPVPGTGTGHDPGQNSPVPRTETGTGGGTNTGQGVGQNSPVPDERIGEDRTGEERIGNSSELSAPQSLTAKPIASSDRRSPSADTLRGEAKTPPEKPGNHRGNGHEPPAVQPPIVERIPLIDGTFFDVGQTFVDELDRAYPAVDPLPTLREIRAWCIANPKNRKTRNGAPRFINSWFSREQNRTPPARN